MAHRSRPALGSRGDREALRIADGYDALKFELSTGTYHALELGERSGTPLVWLHGFPDHPRTAHDFLGALQRPVIAPWLRGYAPSPLHGRLDAEAIANDIIELIDQLREPVDLAGHDWGAVITYIVCMRAPDRIKRAVTLACPHPRTFMRMSREPAQFRRSWYMAFFQLPFAARIARARDFALIDRLWRTWSPGFTLDEPRRRELHACLAASWPAPIRYYRPQRFPGDLITTPMLQLHGANDGCIAPPTNSDEHRFANRVLEVVPGVGHFLHLEDPAGIGRRIDAWLA